MATKKGSTYGLRAEGDGSLNELYRRHGSWLRSNVRSQFRISAAEAEDIVQDAYIRIARQPERLIDQPRSYLAMIARNLFRDRRRREKVRADHREAAADAQIAIVNVQDLSEQEAKYELERLILSMPDLYRDVFLLSRFRHMTNAAIAEHLGLSIKTVEWRMSRALDFCVRQLQG